MQANYKIMSLKYEKSKIKVEFNVEEIKHGHDI